MNDRLSAALSGRYRIERELGAGGMATVYLAFDEKHDRKVAIKVLKPELAAVLGAERFVVEIKTTAAMSHPHILPLFDSGTADGFLFYVMPYIQGETIREKLNRETQFGVDEAVRIAREVADALDYAHRHGVIHRDIKPENILLHDGRAMVMDFGIALAVSAAAGGRMTETGLSLGTPHYMSPEQATAEKEITARSDQYSLASVLYEMLAGQPPHIGGAAQAVIMKIITEQAQPLHELRKNVPANIDGAVAKALEKLPADRFETAAKFGEALGNNDYVRPGSGARGTSASAANRWKQRVAVPLAALLVIVSGLALWGWMRPEPERPLARYQLGLPDSVRLGPNFARIAISRDGAHLAYVAGGDPGRPAGIAVRERQSLAVQKLSGTTGARAPFFSPDGEYVAFFADRTLRFVSLRGGQVTVVATAMVGEYGGSWADDGTIYQDGAGQSGLVRVSATPGSTPVPFTRLDSAQGEGDHVFPEVLPDGRGVIFVIRKGAADGWEIAVADTRTGAHTILCRGIYARYTGSGHLLVVTSSGAVLAAPFDVRKMRLTRTPTALDLQVGVRGTVRVPDLAISADGALFYSETASGLGGTDGEPVWVDRTGRAAPVAAGWTTKARFPALSPEGSQLATSLRTDDGNLDLWVRDLSRGTTTRLTNDGALNFRPAWMPDGRSLFYLSDRAGAGRVFRRRFDGSDRDSLVFSQLNEINEVLVTRDSQWVVYRRGGNSSSDLYARRLTGDTTTIAIATSEFLERQPVVSPDGRYLAYISNETGKDEVYLRPFPQVNDGKWPVSSGGGSGPLWSADGKELFYRRGGDSLISVEVTRTGLPPLGRQRALFSASAYAFEATHRSYDITSDGQRFVMLRLQDERAQTAEQLTVAENFFGELRRKVPR